MSTIKHESIRHIPAYSNCVAVPNIILDPRPRLFKVEPNGSPLVMTLHMNIFAQNRKWEYQPCYNICHHLTFDLYTFHPFFALGDSQNNDVIA